MSLNFNKPKPPMVTLPPHAAKMIVLSPAEKNASLNKKLTAKIPTEYTNIPEDLACYFGDLIINGVSEVIRKRPTPVVSAKDVYASTGERQILFINEKDHDKLPDTHKPFAVYADIPEGECIRALPVKYNVGIAYNRRHYGRDETTSDTSIIAISYEFDPKAFHVEFFLI